MKYWQLTSVVADPDLIKSVAQTNPDWHIFLSWVANESSIIDTQDREKLDYELPDNFVRSVLVRADLICYLSNDGWLRSYQMSPDDKVLTALEAFIKYGGTALEEACEYGCVGVTTHSKAH